MSIRHRRTAMHANICRLFIACLAAMAAAGCTSLHTVPAPSVGYQADVGRVAITTVPDAPLPAFGGSAGNRVEGATELGSDVLKSCAIIPPATLVAEPIGAFMLLIYYGACAATSVGAAGVGAVITPSESSQRKARDLASREIAPAQLQEELRLHVEAAAAARGITVGEPADTTLQVRITALGARTDSVTGPLTAFIDAHARLSAADGRILAEFPMHWTGDSYTRADWLEAGGVRLHEAFVRGYDAIAAEIADRAFLLYPIPGRHYENKPGGQAATQRLGLDARQPGTLAALTPRVFMEHFALGAAQMRESLEWLSADSAQPELAWDAFPREQDVQQAKSEMARVSNVRYDLVVALERNGKPGEIVYRRDGLPASRHRLETQLLPDRHYFWTVRARFTLDGRERVTEWGVLSLPAFGTTTPPAREGYRFRTP